MPKSSQPALDAAAKALAEGRLDAASREFQTISEEPSAPACMRGLAMLGLAEVALARKDFDAADAIAKRHAALSRRPNESKRDCPLATLMRIESNCPHCLSLR
jgi:predicted negative regulator of RcsB-dependent stress response